MDIPKSNFDLAFDYSLVNEGGFSDNPSDHGGATNWGITIETLSKWRARSVSIDDVRGLSATEAKEIYYRWYWLPLGCDGIEASGNSICLFDIGINRGVRVPILYAQRVCNSHGSQVLEDGHCGQKTQAAINALPTSVFIPDFARLVGAGYQAIVANNPSQGIFLKGWLSRAHKLLTLV